MEPNDYTQEELDNHANQLNPNNDAYWQSRGYEEAPDDDSSHINDNDSDDDDDYYDLDEDDWSAWDDVTYGDEW